jgi:hypothetical protein
MIPLLVLSIVSAFIPSMVAMMIFVILMLLAGVSAIITQVILWIVEATTRR